MKRITIILIVAVLAVSSVFAGGLSIGIMQNYLHTGVIADLDLGRFGVEGSVGIPLISGAFELIDYYTGDKVDDEGQPIDPPNPAEALLLPGIMANAYWKAVDSKVFDLRLGIQADAIGLSENDDFTLVGLWGLSLGLDFQFGDNFGVNLTATAPAALIASALGAEDGSFTAFYYTTKEESDWDILLILPACINQFARLSFKWSL